MPNLAFRLLLTLVCVLLIAGCGTRQVQDSLAGVTAQQLVTHSIDDLVKRLPATDFAAHAGKRIYVSSHFVEPVALRDYADRRLEVELARRFDLQIVGDSEAADLVLKVFYTALGTDHSRKGFVLPLGFVPGLEQSTRIDLITLDQFHGVAEMYYFLGPSGDEHRGELLQARTRSDALGLPIISIPINSIDRRGEDGDR